MSVELKLRAVHSTNANWPAKYRERERRRKGERKEGVEGINTERERESK